MNSTARLFQGAAVTLAIASLLGFGCPDIHTTEPSQAADRPLSLTVDGTGHPASSLEVLLCRGVPDVLELRLLQRGEHCPELQGVGGTGAPVSRGRVCLELHLKLENPVVGDEVPAQGSSAAQLNFQQHQEPAFLLRTGDTGPRPDAPSGSIRVDGLEQRESSYLVGISARLEGDGHNIVAEGSVVATPESCLSAGPRG